jgi:hypothetical protein
MIRTWQRAWKPLVLLLLCLPARAVSDGRNAAIPLPILFEVTRQQGTVESVGAKGVPGLERSAVYLISRSSW